MSEAPKTVDEPVAAAPSTETPAAEPVVESAPAVTEPVTETPAATTNEAAAPVKEEVKPVEEGVLGYKAPGLIKGLIFQKKFFWFGSERVETKSLSSYLRGEKPEVANHNAAWASHTGKGLLLFSKKASEKATPAGIINLSEVSDVTPEGTIAFFFHLGGHKHTLEATTLTERDNWVSVLKTKIAEAKELAPSVTEHDDYKKSHSSLSKPVAGAAATPKKSTEVKKEEKAEAKEEAKIDKLEDNVEKKEEKAEKKEEKKEVKERKSRSASRKRNSIFGAIPGFGKKEEKVEAPKEETPAVAPTTEAVTESAAEPVAPVVEDPAATEPAAPVTEEPVVAAPAETKPAPTKRNSIFGTLKSFTQHKEKKPEAEAAPAVPAKDAEPVSETAPVIPAVESTEPLAAAVASPATVPTETTAVTNGDTKAAETPVVKNDKRKSSLPWLTKKEKTTSDEEGEKPLSPFAKLRATVKGKSSPKAEKTAEKPVEPSAEPATATEPTAEAPVADVKPEEPIVSEPIPAAHTSTPQVSATA